MVKVEKKIRFSILCITLSLLIVLTTHMVALLPPQILVKAALQELMQEKEAEITVNGIPTIWREDGLYLGEKGDAHLKIMDFSLLKKVSSQERKGKDYLEADLEKIHFERLGFVSVKEGEKSRKLWKVRLSDESAQFHVELLFQLNGRWKNVLLKQGEMEFDIWRKSSSDF